MKKTFYCQTLSPLVEQLQQRYDLTENEVLRMIDKKKVFLNGAPIIHKTAQVQGEISFYIFEPDRLNIFDPIYSNDDFSVFEKPSGLLVHPNKHNDSFSLLDVVQSHYGKEANIVHRIDKETSGLVLASHHKKGENTLKSLFATGEIYKEYLAYVRGKIDTFMEINAPLLASDPQSSIRLKGCVCENGLPSLSLVYPLSYDPLEDRTTVKLVPKSGRQHQLRLHLFHVKHSILGDPLYGIEEKLGDLYLKGELSATQRVLHTGANRLCLHASKLSFTYENTPYEITSQGNIDELFQNG